jgi:hypothetical protein
LLLNNVKQLLVRIIKEEQMIEYFINFLNNYVLKPAVQVIKKVRKEKEFLINGTFESEVDASIYPIPELVLSLCKIILKERKEIFLDHRGTLSNTISVILGFTFA